MNNRKRLRRSAAEHFRRYIDLSSKMNSTIESISSLFFFGYLDPEMWRAFTVPLSVAYASTHDPLFFGNVPRYSEKGILKDRVEGKVNDSGIELNEADSSPARIKTTLNHSIFSELHNIVDL